MNMDYDNRENEGNKAAKIGIVGNIILTILNAVIGLAAGSTALVAEAADNFADIISSLIGLIAFRIGLKPADKDHPYGHGRIEPIVGLFIALLLLYIAYQIFLDAYTKFVMLNSLAPPGWIAAGMALVALVINMYMSVYLLKTGKKINSHVITATGKSKTGGCISMCCSCWWSGRFTVGLSNIRPYFSSYYRLLNRENSAGNG